MFSKVGAHKERTQVHQGGSGAEVIRAAAAQGQWRESAAHRRGSVCAVFTGRGLRLTIGHCCHALMPCQQQVISDLRVICFSVWLVRVCVMPIVLEASSTSTAVEVQAAACSRQAASQHAARNNEPDFNDIMTF
jgi:hypothetical protein